MGEQEAGAHYRAQKYRLGGLNIMLCDEVDAYYEDGIAPAQDPGNTVNLQSQGNLGMRTHKNATTVLMRGQHIPESRMGGSMPRRTV